MSPHVSTHQELRERLASVSHTAPQDWYPVFKARYGMEAVFKAVADIYGDGEIATQLFTCCTAVDPILSAGMKPVYHDIDSDTFHADDSLMQTQAKAVVLQHTFGLIDHQWVATVKNNLKNTVIIEDCAHCVTRMACEDGTPIADISIHSFGVQKILPTRFGGAIWVNPELAEREPELDVAIRRHLSALSQLTTRLNILTRLYVNQNRLLSRLPAGKQIRHFLTRIKMFEPAISARELRGELEYGGMATSAWIDAQACRALDGLEDNLRTRKNTIRSYITSLKGQKNIEIPRGFLEETEQPFLLLPILMSSTQEADRAIETLRAAGIYAENWYRHDLYPGVDDPADYHVPQSREGLEVTDDIESRILVLPTDIGEEKAAQACHILAQL